MYSPRIIHCVLQNSMGAIFYLGSEEGEYSELHSPPSPLGQCLHCVCHRSPSELSVCSVWRAIIYLSRSVPATKRVNIARFSIYLPSSLLGQCWHCVCQCSPSKLLVCSIWGVMFYLSRLSHYTWFTWYRVCLCFSGIQSYVALPLPG